MTVLHNILASAERFPGRPALIVGESRLSYGELMNQVDGVRLTLKRVDPLPRLIAILAAKSPLAYAGVLGTMFSGRAYMPLNPTFPIERCLQMLKQAKTQVLIVGREALDMLDPLLNQASDQMTILLDTDEQTKALQARHPRHVFRTLERSENFVPLPDRLGTSDLAYVLFTSGSTGVPKGVQITHANLLAYTQNIQKLYGITEMDRFSQVHDLTFDPSAHDMFNAWSNGAALHVLPKSAVMSPVAFIRLHELTYWYSVPSVASFALRLRTLQPSALPSLRVSFFCGEPLPVATAMAWKKAAINSRVENLYGPTEATVSFTGYSVSDETPTHARHEIVPLGKPFPGQRILIVDDQLKRIAAGEVGELLLAGSQVSPGYWLDQAKNNERFVNVAGGGPWYRTGDLVQESAEGGLIFIGRADFQVKVRGFRVELQEIEATLASLNGVDDAVVVPYPVVHGSAEALVAFVQTARLEGDLSREALELCKSRLPEYMVPSRYVVLSEIPRNNNGKVDRQVLIQRLKEESSGSASA